MLNDFLASIEMMRFLECVNEFGFVLPLRQRGRVARKKWATHAQSSEVKIQVLLHNSFAMSSKMNQTKDDQVWELNLGHMFDNPAP